MMYTYKATVDRVIDGDTVDLCVDLGFNMQIARERFRLYEIDAPESRTRDEEEKVYGKMAKHYLQELLPVGQQVFVETIMDKKGKFGRYLGKIFLPEVVRSVNQMMVDDHHAVLYEGQSKEHIAHLHLLNRGYFK